MSFYAIVQTSVFCENNSLKAAKPSKLRKQGHEVRSPKGKDLSVPTTTCQYPPTTTTNNDWPKADHAQDFMFHAIASTPPPPAKILRK